MFPPLHMMAPLGNWFAPELDGRRVVLSTTLQVANKPQLMQILPIRSNLFESPAGHGRGLLPQPILSSFLWFISRGKYLQPLPEATVRRYMLVLRSETKQVHVRTQWHYLVILLLVSACRIDGETVNLAREFYFLARECHFCRTPGR